MSFIRSVLYSKCPLFGVSSIRGSTAVGYVYSIGLYLPMNDSLSSSQPRR